MRPRPIRPNIYLPVVRFGVADSDWFSVLLISCAGYLLPIPFGISLLYVPLQMWTWLIVTAGAIAFFVGYFPNILVGEALLRQCASEWKKTRVIATPLRICKKAGTNGGQVGFEIKIETAVQLHHRHHLDASLTA